MVDVLDTFVPDVNDVQFKQWLADQLQITRTKYFQTYVFAANADVVTGDGAFYLALDNPIFVGRKPAEFHARHITAGSSGSNTTIQINKVGVGDIFKVGNLLTIDVGETLSKDSTTNFVLDNDNNTVVSLYDLYRIDIDTVPTTAPKGLILTIGFI